MQSAPQQIWLKSLVLLICALCLLIGPDLNAQNANVGIGTTTPHPSAKLEVSSTTQGVLIPRMTCEQRDSIASPADGLLVFVTDTCENGDLPGLFYFSAFNLVWKPVVNIFILNANTLDEAYDQGGPGAGRMITVDAGSVKLTGAAANKTLEVSNTTNTAIDVITTTGVGINVGVSGGDGMYVTNTVSEGVEINTTGTGRGLFAENLTDNAGDVMAVNMGGTSAGTYYDGGGRAGYFTLLNSGSPRPALHGHTLGTTFGVLGITDAFSDAMLESLPAAGIAGLNVTDSGRNGVSGLSKKGNGVWGRTTISNSWSTSPSMMEAGIYGTATEGFGLTGAPGTLFTALLGYTSTGISALGHNEGTGHGVVGISKASATSTQAGVWGIIQDGTWAGHVAEYPWLDDAAGTNKGRVAVLGQSKADIGMWAESQTKFGLVATIGPKLGLSTLPAGVDKVGVFALSSHADGLAGFFGNTAESSKPTVIINSLSTEVGLHVMHEPEMGRGMIVQNGMAMPPYLLPAGGKQALVVQQNMCDFSAVDLRLDCEMSMAPTLLVSNVGMGRGAGIVQLNTMATESALFAKHDGLGSAASFEAVNDMNMKPAVEVTNFGKSNGLKILSLDDLSDYALYVENSAGSPGGATGGAAHFNQSAASTATAQTVLITSSTTAGGHKTLVVTPVDLTKTAAEFNGKVDILGDLTAAKDITLTTGDLDISAGELTVGGDGSIGGELTVTEGLTVSGGGFTVTGVSSHTGNFIVYGTMEATACICPSDIRFKENITPLSSALDKILMLDGVSYDWKKNAYPDRPFSDQRQIGFIAQELETLFPELVSTAADGYKGVNYSAMTAVLVQAMKEQQTMINTLKDELAEIKAELEFRGDHSAER